MKRLIDGDKVRFGEEIQGLSNAGKYVNVITTLINPNRRIKLNRWIESLAKIKNPLIVN